MQMPQQAAEPTLGWQWGSSRHSAGGIRVWSHWHRAATTDGPRATPADRASLLARAAESEHTLIIIDSRYAMRMHIHTIF